MNPENHEKANLRQNPRESHDMTTSSTARAERTEELNPYAIVQRQCDNAARYLPEFDPGLFEFLKRPDKLTIVEFLISTDFWRGHKLRRVQVWRARAYGGISMLTPEQVHFGFADQVIARRKAVLREAVGRSSRPLRLR